MKLDFEDMTWKEALQFISFVSLLIAVLIIGNSDYTASLNNRKLEEKYFHVLETNDLFVKHNHDNLGVYIDVYKKAGIKKKYFINTAKGVKLVSAERLKEIKEMELE